MNNKNKFSKKKQKELGKIFFIISVLGFLVISGFSYIAVIGSESIRESVCIIRSVDNLKKGDVVFFKDQRILKSGGLIAKKIGCMPTETVTITKEASFCGKEKMTKGFHPKKAEEYKLRKYELNIDEYFVIGDHPSSYDSRYVGPVKRGSIEKKGIVCF